MPPLEDDEARLRSAALQTSTSILVARQRVEEDLREAKHDLEKKTQELAHSLSLMQATLESTTDGIVSTDQKGKITSVNQRFLRMWGLTLEEMSREREELIGKVAGQLRDPQIFRRRVEEIYTEWPAETYDLLELADGRVFERFSNIQRIDGRKVGRVWSFRDITARRRNEIALREEYGITERLYAVATALAKELDLAKVVQIITDAGTQVTRAQFGGFFYNVLDERGASCMLYALSGVPREAFEKLPMPRATHLFGPTFRGEGVIRSDDIRLDPRFGKNAPYHGMPTDLPVVSYLAVSVISRTGEVMGGLFFGHAQPGVFTERDEKIIVGVAAQAASAMDAARLYQAEQQARAAAEQASQAKDHFLAALSHELRTPLTPVLAILSSLREEAAMPAAWAEDLETVRRNVELEARLIDDLLDLTRITRGKLELHWARVPFTRLIGDAIATCLPEIEAKNLTLERTLDAADTIIRADPGRVIQILWNLLKNAVKFTPKGGTVSVRTWLAHGDRVVFEVGDSGIGIEPAQLPYVFDAFEQGDRRITRQFGGLGLGLAISKAIAESHRGTLVAASEGPGRGATFTLTLPVQAVEGGPSTPAAAARAPRIALAPAPLTHRALRILLVEDHTDTAAILVRLLRRMGHDVLHAATIGDALQTAEQEMQEAGLDLVVSDLGLPDGSGLDLMRELSTKHGLRGIALSGFGMESDVAQSRAAGFARHFTKPIDIAVIKEAIQEMTV
jgi:PAS domain S-box-containing protein